METRTATKITPHPVLLLAGIFLIATNLRAPFTSIAPLLDGLKESFHLNATQAGMLITLPLLAFALVSPFAAGLARRWGLERTLLLALIVIGAGVLLRSVGSIWSLYLGTWIIGSGIALGNVLLPAILKRDFPEKVAPLTATYVLAMGIAAASMSAVAIPLSQFANFDWRLEMACLILLPAIGILVWLPQVFRETQVTTKVRGPLRNVLWRSPIAWQVTFFLGFDCFLYYVGVSWLPAILEDGGYSTEQAGSMHGVLLLATAIPGLILIPIVPRMKDQRAVACFLSLSIAVGLLGLLIAPKFAVLWVLVFGFGAGGGLILALSFISLRTPNAQYAAGLSGMAQCVGYLVASAGPPVIGRMHDATGSWSIPLTVCVLLGGIMAVVGYFAGRDVQLSDVQPHVGNAIALRRNTGTEAVKG